MKFKVECIEKQVCIIEAESEEKVYKKLKKGIVFDGEESIVWRVTKV